MATFITELKEESPMTCVCDFQDGLDDWERNADDFVLTIETQIKEENKKKTEEEQKLKEFDKLQQKKARIIEKERIQKEFALYESYKAQLKEAQISLEVFDAVDYGPRLLCMSDQWSSSCNLDDVAQEEKSYARRMKRFAKKITPYQQKELEKNNKEKEKKLKAKRDSILFKITTFTNLINQYELNKQKTNQ